MVIREYAFSAGLAHRDDVYVDHATRRVYDVQDTQEGTPRLAMEMDRSWAARWLNIRRTAPNRVLSEGRLMRLTVSSVPHLPVGPYAAADKIVLHGEGVEPPHYGRKYGTDEHGAAYIEFELDAFAGEEPEDCAICGETITYGGWVCLDGGENYCESHIVYDLRPDSLFERVGAIRGEELPPFAWPGGYLIAYYCKSGSGPICADCASDPSAYDFDSDPVVGAQALEGDYEIDYDLPAVPMCEACSRPLDPADRSK